MMTLVEKEARDPVDVLRLKLKDSTSSSLLNSHLLHDIKMDYLIKQNSTSGQLAGFVQAQVDEIERASTLLALATPVTDIVTHLTTLRTTCLDMNEELGEKKVSSANVSIARRNLKDLELQMIWYQEVPAKLHTLATAFETGGLSIVEIYTQWQTMDDTRQTLLHEVTQFEPGNRQVQAHLLTSLASRFDPIEALALRIDTEVWGCLHHCLDLALLNPTRLGNALQVIELMATRQARFRSSSSMPYRDNQLTPSPPCPSMHDRMETELETAWTQRLASALQDAGAHASLNRVSATLERATQFMMELDSMQAHVVPCFPPDVDLMHLVTRTYTAQFERAFLGFKDDRDLTLAHRLELIQWIDYYNSEIIKYPHSRASTVLAQLAHEWMASYLTDIARQMHTWVTNLWKRDDEDAKRGEGVAATRANEIVNILKSQLAIAHEYLSGGLLARVVTTCLRVLMDEIQHRFDSLALQLDRVDVERLCLFINDAEILQAKCPELVAELAFADTAVDEKEAFETIVGDRLDTTSMEIVAFATNACHLIVDKILHDVEQETVKLWWSKKWDDGAPVVATLMATLDDYYVDLQQWIVGSFFFSKIVRQSLARCVQEYQAKLLQRTHRVVDGDHTATIVDQDFQTFVTFFDKYQRALRQTGLRSTEDIAAEFTLLQVMASTLRNAKGPESGRPETKQVQCHLVKLLRASHESGGSKPKETKVKKKRFGAIKKQHSSKKRGDSTGHEHALQDESESFVVQKLDMAAFLKS